MQVEGEWSISTSSWIAKKNNLKPVFCSPSSVQKIKNKSVMEDGKVSLSEILGVLMCGLCGCAAMPAPTHLGSLQ